MSPKTLTASIASIASILALGISTPALAQSVRAQGADAPRAAGAPATQAPVSAGTQPSHATGLPGVVGVARSPGSRMDAPARAGAIAPLAPDARISFNLHDAELREVVRAIADITGRRFVVPARVREVRLSTYSPSQVTAAEAYQAFLAVLAANGLTVVPTDSYSVIEETASIATRPIPVSRDGEPIPTDTQFITRVHRLRGLTANQAAAFLNAYRSRDGQISAHPADNAVVLTDSGVNVQRMLRLLDAVDTTAGNARARSARPTAVPAPRR